MQGLTKGCGFFGRRCSTEPQPGSKGRRMPASPASDCAETFYSVYKCLPQCISNN